MVYAQNSSLGLAAHRAHLSGLWCGFPVGIREKSSGVTFQVDPGEWKWDGKARGKVVNIKGKSVVTLPGVPFEVAHLGGADMTLYTLLVEAGVEGVPFLDDIGPGEEEEPEALITDDEKTFSDWVFQFPDKPCLFFPSVAKHTASPAGFKDKAVRVVAVHQVRGPGVVKEGMSVSYNGESAMCWFVAEVLRGRPVK